MRSAAPRIREPQGAHLGAIGSKNKNILQLCTRELEMYKTSVSCVARCPRKHAMACLLRAEQCRLGSHKTAPEAGQHVTLSQEFFSSILVQHDA